MRVFWEQIRGETASSSSSSLSCRTSMMMRSRSSRSSASVLAFFGSEGRTFHKSSVRVGTNYLANNTEACTKVGTTLSR